MEYNELTSCKRSFAVYCSHVHGVSDRTVLLEWFEALQPNFDSVLDFHVAIILAFAKNQEMS